MENCEPEGKERVQREVRHVEEEMRQARTVALSKQGRWLNWEGTQARKLTWDAEIWKVEANRMSYLMKSL